MKLALILIASTAASSFCLASANASPETCAPCHRAQTSRFGLSGMARALESGKNAAILRANPKLTTKIGNYSYEIARVGDESIYTVTDGKEKIRVPLAWAFGQGAAGQTYLFERDGKWYESTVSYYSALQGLDLTMGARNSEITTLSDAAGKVREPAEAGDCFNCHATNAVKRSQLTLSVMTPGVQCERCHGPTDQHVPTQRSGNVKPAAMRKLGELSTEEMSDFCGQCHRTWSDIAANGPRGILNVRFQPYRLGNSKCYDAEDRRIRCTSCHDPHREPETRAAAYDAKCLACHSSTATPSTKASAHICKVASKACTSCHMPRLELPDTHNKFTDHRIRIVKANEKYPD
jgi:hypothetical protein